MIKPRSVGKFNDCSPRQPVFFFSESVKHGRRSQRKFVWSYPISRLLQRPYRCTGEMVRSFRCKEHMKISILSESILKNTSLVTTSRWRNYYSNFIYHLWGLLRQSHTQHSQNTKLYTYQSEYFMSKPSGLYSSRIVNNFSSELKRYHKSLVDNTRKLRK